MVIRLAGYYTNVFVVNSGTIQTQPCISVYNVSFT